MKILVTGANGFVGQRFLNYNRTTFDIEIISLRNDDWKTKNFANIDAVIHLAGKAHEMQKIDDQIYFDINYELTKKLFEKVKNEGVKQFIYISSTKVYGDDEYDNLNEQSPCNPTDAYGKSKLQAEQYLLAQTNTIVSIVRPPLIYGPGVKGNMQKIMELCNSNKPLPFANIQNKRSMVYVDNLIELINAITFQKKAGVFIGGDVVPLSTTTLVAEIRSALGKKRNLFSIPIFVRKLLKKLKPALYIRLFGSFYVDTTVTNRVLNFVPKYESKDGIASMVKEFLNKK
jgi:nucleoside-diphosphate-sugar epimerase